MNQYEITVDKINFIKRMAEKYDLVYEENKLGNGEKDLNRVDVVTFSPIVLWSTGEIGVNDAIESLRLWRKNINTKSLKLTEERLNKELKNFKLSLESMLQAQKIVKMNQKLEKMDNDF